jgi:hypothetical protein
MSFKTVYAVLMACLISAQTSVNALELHDVAITYRSYEPGSRLPYMPGLIASQGISIGFEIAQGFDLYPLGIPIRTSDRFLFWENEVVGTMSGPLFKHVGWRFRYGVRVFDWLEVTRFHFSQHVLDMDWPGPFSWPLEDGWQFKIYLLR